MGCRAPKDKASSAPRRIRASSAATESVSWSISVTALSSGSTSSMRAISESFLLPQTRRLGWLSGVRFTLRWPDCLSCCVLKHCARPSV